MNRQATPSCGKTRPHSPAKWTLRARAVAILAPFCTVIATHAGAQQVIKYGAAANSFSHAPPFLAEVSPEIFAKHNLKLEITDFKGKSVNCVTALISGQVDVCQVGTTTGTDAIVEGANFKAVAVTTGPINEVILSAKTVAKLGVKADAPIDERLRALKGLRIVTAAPGSAHYTTLGSMLKRVGLGMGDLKYRTLGDAVAMMESIRHDQIDGALWTIGSLSGLLVDGSGVRWISVPRGDVPELKSIPFVTVYAQTAWVEKNPDVAARLNAALADAIARLKTEPAKYSKLLKAKYYPDLSQAMWDDGFQQSVPSYFEGAKAPRAGWEQLLKMQAEGTGKTYASAAFDKVLLPMAQAK
jgi:NitT/TauT family transport system substrate-binding protein